MEKFIDDNDQLYVIGLHKPWSGFGPKYTNGVCWIFIYVDADGDTGLVHALILSISYVNS